MYQRISNLGKFCDFEFWQIIDIRYLNIRLPLSLNRWFSEIQIQIEAFVALRGSECFHCHYVISLPYVPEPVLLQSSWNQNSFNELPNFLRFCPNSLNLGSRSALFVVLNKAQAIVPFSRHTMSRALLNTTHMKRNEQ